MRELFFTVSIPDKVVQVSVVSLQNALFIWVGDNMEFNNFNVGTCNNFSKVPSTVDLFGTNTNSMMAQKLCKRFRKQVMLSYNVDVGEDSTVDDIILKCIIEKLVSSLP